MQGASVFYNENLKQRAYKQFTKTWGELKLADNWRMKPQKSNDAIAQGADSDVDPMEEEFKSPKYDPETYISQIPTEQKVIDSISDDRNFAYYQLGIIYKEKFKRYDLATDKLESVLKQNPGRTSYFTFKILFI